MGERAPVSVQLHNQKNAAVHHQHLPHAGQTPYDGQAKASVCPFCAKEAETLCHWQQICPQFHDARTKVHDDIPIIVR